MPRQNTTPTNAEVQLVGGSLSTFLGFNSDFMPPVGCVSSRNDWQFIGDNRFVYTDVSDAFLVLLDSLKLTSCDDYDKDNTRKGGRRNLLSVIPSTDISGYVVYSPNNHLWIDMDNAYPIQLRNIKARIVKNDYTPVPTLASETCWIRTLQWQSIFADKIRTISKLWMVLSQIRRSMWTMVVLPVDLLITRCWHVLLSLV